MSRSRPRHVFLEQYKKKKNSPLDDRYATQTASLPRSARGKIKKKKSEIIVNYFNYTRVRVCVCKPNGNNRLYL